MSDLELIIKRDSFNNKYLVNYATDENGERWVNKKLVDQYNQENEDEITRLKERVEELKRENEAKDAIIKAVAHIGIDWGYGSYELESKFIDQARALYEKNEKRQDPSLQPTLESRL